MERVEEQKEQPVKAKLSYEELEYAASQLSMQVQQLQARLNNLQVSNIIERLNLLFKVVELKDMFNADFVYLCSKEIENTLTLPEVKEEIEK